MRLAARTALYLAVLVPLAVSARATVLYGEVEAVANESSYWHVVLGEATPPFGLAPDSLVGTRATIRFWLDTGALPIDLVDEPGSTVFSTDLAEPEWLTMEIEINGVTSRPGPGTSMLNLYEWDSQRSTDYFLLEHAACSYPPNGPSCTEGLKLVVEGNDLGPAGVIPQSFDLITFAAPPARNANIFWLDRSELDPVTGEPTVSYLALDFDLVSARMHPVPEPAEVTLLTCLAVLAAGYHRARRVTR